MTKSELFFETSSELTRALNWLYQKYVHGGDEISQDERMHAHIIIRDTQKMMTEFEKLKDVQQQNYPLLLTVAEFAKVCRISVNTARRWITIGHIGTVRFTKGSGSGKRLIPRSELERLLDEVMKRGEEEATNKKMELSNQEKD